MQIIFANFVSEKYNECNIICGIRKNSTYYFYIFVDHNKFVKLFYILFNTLNNLLNSFVYELRWFCLGCPSPLFNNCLMDYIEIQFPKA